MKNSFENCVSTYMEDVSQYPVMSRGEELDAFRRLEAADETARDLIVQSNLRFVVKIALSYQGKGLPLGDLIQEGNMGLLEVIDRFDYRLGYRFSTYAAFWIRQSIQSALKKRSSMIHVPVRKARQSDKLNSMIEHQRLTSGHAPTTADLADVLETDETKVRELAELRHMIISIDRTDSDDTGNIGETLKDFHSVNARENIMGSELRHHIDNALAALTQREREILELRFGLNDGVEKSLREVSRRVSLSQEGVRRIERRAFDKLRRNDATIPLTECA